MKKLIMIMVMIFITIGFVSCGHYHDAPPNEFIVEEVLPRENMKFMTTYKVTMLDASGLGGVEFWVVDSIGKYKVGDKLMLQRSK